MCAILQLVSAPLTLFGQGGEGAESARAHFNFQELPCYLSNSYEILALLIKIIREQDFVKKKLSWVQLVAMATRFSTPCLVKFFFF